MVYSIDIDRIHKLDYRLLMLIAIIQPIFSLIINILFSRNFNPIIEWSCRLSEWSYYLINPTLQANLIILIIFCFIIFKMGKHNLSSIWLNRENLRSGVTWGLIFWLIIQVSVFLYLLFTGSSLSLIQNINKETGALLGQFFGNALNEELIFRGIFFLQFYILLRKRFSDRTAFFISIIVSQLFFAVVHLPNRIFVNKHYKNLFIDQIGLFLLGILFVIFYVRTKNFVLSVTMHSFLNNPLRIFNADIPYIFSVVALYLLAIIFWNKMRTKWT